MSSTCTKRNMPGSIARNRHWVPLASLLGLILLWFAPVMFAGKVFISDNTMPGFFLPVQWWSDLLYSGFPLLADPTFANAYPVRIVLSATVPLAGKAHAYNLYVVSAYAIAAVGAYAYVVEITGSRLAGAIGASGFAFCGFLQAHLGHETITHTAAWLPAVVWATHRVVLREGRREIAWLALLVALAYLGNHPQITFQIGVVSVLYALVLLPDVERRLAALARFGCAWLLGIALVAWHIVPSWENGSLSMRGLPPSKLTLDGALPLDQAIQLAMPWLFGGWPPSAAAPIPAFGDKLYVEIVNYIPSAVLMLAAVAVVASSRRVISFWAWIALVFFVLTLGPQTILGEIRFFTPVFNLFNNPARDILTVHFAVAVLAGTGAALLARGGIEHASLRRALVLGLLPTIVALLLYPTAVHKAANAGVTLPSIWDNIAVRAPLGIAAGAAAALVLAHRFRGAVAASVLLAIIVLGCGYFGWFAPWKLYSGYAQAATDEPPAATALHAMRKDKGGRLAVGDGWLGPAGVSPNSSMMFGLPSIAGYGPLLPRQYAHLARLTNSGWMQPDMLQDRNRAIDLLSARWIFPHAPAPAVKPTVAHDIPFNPVPIGQYIGGSCMGAPLDAAMSFRLPRPMHLSRIALVTTLGCAPAVPQGMEVVNVSLYRDNSPARQVPLIAGRDTAEWSVACETQKIAGAHGIARTFDSVPAPGGGTGCLGHHYLADLQLDGAAATSIRIEWTGQRFPLAFLHVKHVTVFDQAGQAYPLRVADQLLANEGRWKRWEVSKDVEVFENLRALPLAWLVEEIVRVGTEDNEFAAIHTGKLAGGDPFDPARHAISSDPQASGLLVARPAGSAPRAGAVAVEEWDGATKAFSVDAPAPMLLVVSNRFHPGWRARVDGEERPVLRVNGALQGIPIPQGKHRATLAYRPTNFSILLAVGALALVVIAWLLRGPGRVAARLAERKLP
jgi:Bacterial membrane protein YfhO